MKIRALLVLFLLLTFVFLSDHASLAAPEADDEASAITYTYEADNPPAELLAIRDTRTLTGYTDIYMQGTMWQPQFKGHFTWAVKTSGVETQAAAGFGGTYQWVHIAIPYPWAIDSTMMKIDEVTFCMKADHPTRTIPTKVELWSQVTKIFSGPMNWTNNSGIQCHTVDFSPAVQAGYLGVSVLVKYYNSTDMVTLHGVWARFVP